MAGFKVRIPDKQSCFKDWTSPSVQKLILWKEKGYLVRVPGYKSKTFSQLTEDENLQLAKTHLNYIMNSVQRLNDNGEEIP